MIGHRLSIPQEGEADRVLFRGCGQVECQLEGVLEDTVFRAARANIKNYVSDEVKVDEARRPRTEDKVVALGLDVKPQAHGSLDVPLVFVDRAHVELRGNANWRVVVFDGDED